MAGTTAEIDITQAAPAASRERRRLGALALFAAVYTYALVVFGGIVRISGSGLGCGDDWPRCHGQWIPAFTPTTLIEYTHRLLAAGIGVVVLAVFLYAFVNRRRAGFGGRGGMLRPLVLGAVLLVLQVALGAITVRLELPPQVTVAHFITAMLFMATLLVTAVRGGVLGDPAAGAVASATARHNWRAAIAATLLGLIVVAFGAVTANTPGAPQACQGFPLCNGALLPAGAPTVHIQWTHRLFAFLLFFHVIGAAIGALRRGATQPVRRAAVAAAVLVTAQLVVAMLLVLRFLPPPLQALHLAVGAAIWFALVVWAGLARRQLTAATLG